MTPDVVVVVPVPGAPPALPSVPVPVPGTRVMVTGMPAAAALALFGSVTLTVTPAGGAGFVTGGVPWIGWPEATVAGGCWVTTTGQGRQGAGGHGPEQSGQGQKQRERPQRACEAGGGNVHEGCPFVVGDARRERPRRSVRGSVPGER